MFEPSTLDPVGTPAAGSAGLSDEVLGWPLDPEPSEGDRAVIERILAAEAEDRAAPSQPGSVGPAGVDLARLRDLAGAALTTELFARTAYARGLRAVDAVVAEVLAQDRAMVGHERSEAVEHAAHEVAAALGVSRRTAEIRLEDARLLVQDNPRTLAVLEAGYVPVPAARELAHRLAGHQRPLRRAVEARVLDALGQSEELPLGSMPLQELELVACLEPSRVATVSMGATRGRVRDLVARALRDLAPAFEAKPDPTGTEDAASDAERPVPADPAADVEAWPTRPGLVFVGSEMTEADAVAILDGLDHTARSAKRAGDPRSLPELRAARFRDLLRADPTRSTGTHGRDDDASAEVTVETGPVVVPVHLTVHLVDDRTTVDADRLGPVTPRTLTDLIDTARYTGGTVGARLVRLPHCPGQHGEPGPYQPSDRLREAVLARDRTCRFPGCTVAARSCDLDHTVPHPRGPTCGCNLACLCRTHHRLKTAGRWRLANHGQGRLTWTSPTGRTYPVAPDPV